MKVTIDPYSGFCFGVVHAVDVAERELKAGRELYCLGDIVHNDMEVERLRELGMTIIGADEFRRLKNCRVLIRAHGEPPETYRIAIENNIELIDASCPIVLKLQNEILNGYNEMKEKNGQVVIYGREGHAEVNGLTGQTNGEAIVIKDEDDLERIDFSRPVRLYSQTTMSKEGFRIIAEMIRDRIMHAGNDGSVDFAWNDSICSQVSNRSGQLTEFAKRFEVILFVTSRKSSNGMHLYEICKKMNPRTYLVTGSEDLEKEWFNGVSEVGICGATSTPKWLMERVGEEIIKINRQ